MGGRVHHRQDIGGKNFSDPSTVLGYNLAIKSQVQHLAAECHKDMTPTYPYGKG